MILQSKNISFINHSILTYHINQLQSPVNFPAHILDYLGKSEEKN